MNREEIYSVIILTLCVAAIMAIIYFGEVHF